MLILTEADTVRALEHVEVYSPNLEHRRDFARMMSAPEPGQTVSWVYRVAKEHGIGTEVELR